MVRALASFAIRQPLFNDHLDLSQVAGCTALLDEWECRHAQDDSRRLAQSLVGIGNASGVRTEALITDMDAPLGHAVGNSIEVIESFIGAPSRGDLPAIRAMIRQAIARPSCGMSRCTHRTCSVASRWCALTRSGRQT